MKDIKTLTLKELTDRETEHMEEEVLNKEELTSIEVTSKMDRDMAEKIRQYEEMKAKRKNEYADEAEHYLSEEDKKALAIGRKAMEKDKNRVRCMPKNPKLWVALVALMVLLAAAGMTGVGSKSYWKELWSRMVGEQENTVINVKDAEILESEDGDIIDYYTNIETALDIKLVTPTVVPKNMVARDCEIDEQLRRAKVFYEYNGKIIVYSIYTNDEDSSHTQIMEDLHTDTFNVETEKLVLNVQEYLIEESQEYRYLSYFEYGGVYYQLIGIMNREDFVEILKNLNYF